MELDAVATETISKADAEPKKESKKCRINEWANDIRVTFYSESQKMKFFMSIDTKIGLA